MRFLLTSLLALVLPSCQMPELPSGGARVSLDSDGLSAVEVKVWVEGGDGTFLTGAAVNVLGPGGELSLLGFDSSRGVFFGKIDTLASGTFQVAVRSRGLSDQIVLAVPHQHLLDEPNVTALVDTAGADALYGEPLSSALPVAVQWKAVEGASVYGVVAYQGFEVVFSEQSLSPSLLIPAGVLPEGALKIQVTASYQAGDPFFRTGNWVSTSQTVGSLVSLIMAD